MIASIIMLVVAAVVVWHLAETVIAFNSSTALTRNDRLKEAFRHSLTIFWARFTAFTTLAIAVVAEGSNYLGVPGLKETIEPYMTPQLMLIYTLVVIIGAEASRRRTLE